MGIFSRFMDIVNANINALLDKAEDPEKMVRLMLQEVEDTLIELKASCAAEMGRKATAERKLREQEEIIQRWLKRAELAISKARDDLAREALLEKRRSQEESERLKESVASFEKSVAQCKADISRLEEKLTSLRLKHQSIVEASRQGERASENLQKSADERFERMEQQLNRMEWERSVSDLEQQFFDLEQMDEVEEELELLRKKGKQ
ncbi:MAG: PspA/IM30 family protein [Sphaerochaetaceae bacterium]